MNKARRGLYLNLSAFLFIGSKGFKVAQESKFRSDVHLNFACKHRCKRVSEGFGEAHLVWIVYGVDRRAFHSICRVHLMQSVKCGQ